MKHGAGSYFFDFAIPKLRLLLEIDGWSYHHTRRQRVRDACKHKFAEEQGWKLIRLKNKSKVGQRAVKAIGNYRREKLSKFAGTDDPGDAQANFRRATGRLMNVAAPPVWCEKRPECLRSSAS